MKIEGLQIDGFGRFDRQEFGPFSRGVTVIHGPNEAGKSTIHAFIRAVLFGFPRRGSADWIPSLSGSRHGGRILLRDEDGQRFVVERHSDTRRGAARVMLAGGETGDDQLLSELLGNVTSDIFQTIFAFGVDELQSMESLPADAVSGRIYAAGLGAERLPEAVAYFQAQAGERFLPRGRVQPVVQIFRELETIDRELAEIRSTFETYHRLRERRDQIGTDSRAIEHKLVTIEGLQQKLSLLELTRETAAERLDQAGAELAEIARSIEEQAPRQCGSGAGSDSPSDPFELRVQIDELRETWTRLQASHRMMEVYQGTVARQSTPRGPVFLAVLITGTVLPLLIGALTGQRVVIAIGIASAVLGAVTLVLAVIARSRFDTAQTQARIHLEITHRDAEGRFLHAAMATGIDTARIDAELERLERKYVDSELSLASQTELLERRDVLAAQQQRVDRATANVATAEQDLDDARQSWMVLAQRLGIGGPPAASPAQARAAIERERDELLVERGGLNERIMQLETETRDAELRTRRAYLLTSLREHAHEWAVNVVAGTLLREARRIYEADRQPAVLQAASEAFDAMTLGAHHRLVIADGHDEIVALARDGRHVAVSEMSRGTREQAYLALRIGLIREFGARIRTLPVLIDDVLVNFDPERAAEAMRALNNLASEHQVLIFTCHPTTVALARFLNPSARVITLDEQRISGLAPVWIENS